jgi:uncharacterized protein YlxW (UPF0749 family)
MGSSDRRENLMPKDQLSERIRQVQEEAQILGEEVKVLTEKVKEHSRVAQERADETSARLKRLKGTTTPDKSLRRT